MLLTFSFETFILLCGDICWMFHYLYTKQLSRPRKQNPSLHFQETYALIHVTHWYFCFKDRETKPFTLTLLCITTHLCKIWCKFQDRMNVSIFNKFLKSRWHCVMFEFIRELPCFSSVISWILVFESVWQLVILVPFQKIKTPDT